MTQGGGCSLVSELHHPQSSPKALATGSTSIELVFLEDSLLSVVLGPAAWAAPGSQLEMQTLRTLPRHRVRSGTSTRAQEIPVPLQFEKRDCFKQLD